MSRAKVLLTEAARADLDEAIDYLLLKAPDAALQLLERVEDPFARLRDYPELGHARDDLTIEGIRFWTVDTYWIAYRIHSGHVEVLRVLHGARDVTALGLGDEKPQSEG